MLCITSSELTFLLNVRTLNQHLSNIPNPQILVTTILFFFCDLNFFGFHIQVIPCNICHYLSDLSLKGTFSERLWTPREEDLHNCAQVPGKMGDTEHVFESRTSNFSFFFNHMFTTISYRIFRTNFEIKYIITWMIR